MNVEEARLLYDYNSWANGRSLDACVPLSAEQFTRDMGSSFHSVRDTLQHIMGAESVWTERWLGRSPSAIPAEGFTDLKALRDRWQTIDAALRGFIHTLTPADMDRVLEYRTTKGVTCSNPMRETLGHLANHGTYHRGQVATMLRQLGATPLSTDMIAFYRERAGNARS